MKLWFGLGLLVGLLAIIGIGTTNLWYQQADSGSLTDALLNLREQREVLLAGPLRQTAAPAQQPLALTVAGILAETNRHRAEAGLPALTLDTTLSQAAQNKVNDMFAGQYFEHVSPSGVGPSDVVDAVGYDYARVGENLALGIYQDDADLVQAWMDSPGHRENMLKPGFSEIGLAASPGQFEGHRTWLAVQTFALPLSACPEVDLTLQQKIDADQAAIVASNSDLETRLAEIEQERLALSDLVDDISSLIEQGNAKIAEGNAVAQESGNEAAQPLWDEGTALHEQARTKQDEHTARQADFNNVVATYNADVDAQREDSDELESLIAQVNQQVRAFNACLEE